MPFGGLLTLLSTGLGLGGSIANGVIGSRAAGNAADTQSDAEKQLLALIQKTIPEANSLISGGTADANKQLLDYYNKNLALLQPYMATGTQALDTLNKATAPGGDLNRRFGASDFQADPGYAFRLQQGQQAIERSAAARTGAVNGGTLKDLDSYSQGLASQEYGNAFDRFRTQNNDIFSRLNSLAGLGSNATNAAVGAGNLTGTQTSNNITEGAARQSTNDLAGLGLQGDAITGGANARASGYVGQANATSGAINGASNSLQNLLLLSKLFKN